MEQKPEVRNHRKRSGIGWAMCEWEALANLSGVSCSKGQEITIEPNSDTIIVRMVCVSSVLGTILPSFQVFSYGVPYYDVAPLAQYYVVCH